MRSSVKPKRREARQLERFKQVINYCGFHDLGFVGPPFTWSKSYRTEGRLCIHLDRALANTEWKRLFQGAVLHHLSSSTSDHSILYLRFKRTCHHRRPPSKIFRFEEMWLQDSCCVEVVQDSWYEGLYKPDGHPITNCLDNCREGLLAWNKSEFGHVGRKIDSLQKRLQMLETLPSTLAIDTKICEVRSALNVWLDAENTMWRQRSRNFWLTEGDRNTSFFHTKAINRKQRNTIHGLCDANGVWQENELLVEQIVVEYFSDMFHSNGPTDTTTLIEAIEPVVSMDMNNFLTQEFRADEVHKSLKQMHLKKSPGPNGMPPLFCQHFWSLVGDCVTKTVLDFLNHGITPLKFNETHIVLIPKIKNPKMITQFRPISLSNVISRLASKVLANRLKRFLPKIINEN